MKMKMIEDSWGVLAEGSIKYVPEDKAKQIITVLHDWYKCGRYETFGLSLEGTGRGIHVTAELFAKTAFPAFCGKEFSQRDDAMGFIYRLNEYAVKKGTESWALVAAWGVNEDSHVVDIVLYDVIEEAYKEWLG